MTFPGTKPPMPFQPFRSLAYVLVTLLTAMASSVIGMLGFAAALTVPLGAGVVALPGWLATTSRWMDWHRRRASRLLGLPPHDTPALASAAGLSEALTVLRAPSTRRRLLWLPLHFLLGTLTGMVGVLAAGSFAVLAVIPFWWAFPAQARLQVAGFDIDGWLPAGLTQLGFAAVTLVLVAWVVPGLARAHARMCVKRLTPSRAELLEQRVDALTKTRSGVVDAHGAELRRIERSLHDGTQARLVSIAMAIGLARESESMDPAVARLLEDAHRGTEEAMAELRSVIRTIYPPILADRGLDGALAALGDRTGTPVWIESGDLGVVPKAVEAAVYFVISESIANANVHGRAQRIDVRLQRDADRLSVVIRDDGVGGADENRGTGLAGIRSRIAALDGQTTVDSPAGGPTTITVSLPCE